MKDKVKVNQILICGNIAGCGKTTAAQYLSEKYEFAEFFFAQPIYDIARSLFGMKGKDRKLLIAIGQKMREIDPEVWIRKTYNNVGFEHHLHNTNVCISDCRQENEYLEGVRRGYLPIRINCDRDEAINRIVLRDGHCDTSLLDTEGEIGTRHIPMINIDNNGSIEHLQRQLDDIVTKDLGDYINYLQTAEKYLRV